MTTRPSARDLLIALNADPHLPRAVICRLGANLDLWASGTPPPGRAARGRAGITGGLGVPGRLLERALGLLPEAGESARREEEAAGTLGARLVTCLDAGYPAPLVDLPLPPPVLYVRGDLPAGPAVAIVGSRQADPYGLEVAGLFARTLAAAGIPIVSGFARGVDAAAHRGALAAASGRTVAVLGCGLGVDYPRGHRALGSEIAGRGAQVSELPCLEPPRPRHFPVRNRIIAALAAGTLVVQANARSGSLSTARHALDLGREIFAVPGRIFDARSIGPNTLIRDGATPVQHPREILAALGLAESTLLPAPGTATAPSSGEEATGEPPPPGTGGVLAALPRGANRSPDELAELAGLAVDRVLAALLELELTGHVKRHPGPLYERL